MRYISSMKNVKISERCHLVMSRIILKAREKGILPSPTYTSLIEQAFCGSSESIIVLRDEKIHFKDFQKEEL